MYTTYWIVKDGVERMSSTSTFDEDVKDPNIARYKEKIRRVFALFDPDNKGVCSKQYVAVTRSVSALFSVPRQLACS